MLKKSTTVNIIAAALLSGAGLGIAAGFAPARPAPAAPAPAAADGYKVDAVHSAVIYRVKHNNVAYHYGRFDKVEGTFLLDKENASSSSINVTVPVESVSSGNSSRDGHLKKADFFSAAEFPTMSFKSTEVTKKGEADGYPVFTVKGDFTMHGVTKPITVDVKHTGEGSGQRGQVAGFETTFTIKRSDYGMNFMQGKGLGDDVTITVSLEGGR